MGSFSVRRPPKSKSTSARKASTSPNFSALNGRNARVWRSGGSRRSVPAPSLPATLVGYARLRSDHFIGLPHARLPLLRSLPYRVRNNTNMASPDKSPSKWSKASGSPVGNAMKMMSALKAAGAKLDVVDHDGPIGDDQHAAARPTRRRTGCSRSARPSVRAPAFHAQLAHVRNVQQSALRGGVHQTEKLQARLRCTRRSKELIAADKAEQEELAAAAAAAAAAEVEPTGA